MVIKVEIWCLLQEINLWHCYGVLLVNKSGHQHSQQVCICSIDKNITGKIDFITTGKEYLITYPNNNTSYIVIHKLSQNEFIVWRKNFKTFSNETSIHFLQCIILIVHYIWSIMFLGCFRRTVKVYVRRRSNINNFSIIHQLIVNRKYDLKLSCSLMINCKKTWITVFFFFFFSFF